MGSYLWGGEFQLWGSDVIYEVEISPVVLPSAQITVTDRAPLESSKKWGALHVINNLFKIYFQLNNLRLCQNLIRAVEGPGFPKASLPFAPWRRRSPCVSVSVREWLRL